MKIKSIVQKIVSKFNTNNPFSLAEGLGIIIIKLPLGNVKGCYKLIQRRKIIFINSLLDYWEQRVVCAHELGHAIMHPNINCNFIQNYTLLSVEKIEIEANKFCANLLLDDNIMSEYECFTYAQIAQATSIPVEIVKLRQAQI